MWCHSQSNAMKPLGTGLKSVVQSSSLSQRLSSKLQLLRPVHNMVQGHMCCIASRLCNVKISIKLRFFMTKCKNATQRYARIGTDLSLIAFHCVAASANTSVMQRNEGPCVILWTGLWFLGLWLNFNIKGCGLGEGESATSTTDC